jgi:sorting and assembly machinery component 37
MGDSPTSTDIILASYILPLLYIPFPNSVVSSELRKSYDTLAVHAERVLEHSQVRPAAPLLPTPTVRSSLSAVFNGWRKNTNVFAQEKEKGPAAEKAASRKYGKWLFGLAAGVGSIVYLLVTGIISVQLVDEDEIEVTPDMLELDEEEEEE